MMNDDELLRYSRQILLKDVDVSGQEKLKKARVLIFGVGGLGSPAAMYLASSGIGSLTLSDFDEVDLSNLQRQILFNESQLGMLKADAAIEYLSKINSSVHYHAISKVAEMEELCSLVNEHDVVLDCTDNFESRFKINAACVGAETPLVSGAVIRMEGQITTFDFRPKAESTEHDQDAACYHCLYGDLSVDDEQDTCSTTGVLAPVAGIIGCMQAAEALKLLLGLPVLSNRLQILDAKYMEWREIKLRKDNACSVCGGQVVSEGKYSLFPH